MVAIVDNPLLEEEQEFDQPILPNLAPVAPEGKEVRNRRVLEAAVIKAGTEDTEDIFNAWMILAGQPDKRGDELRAEATGEAFQRLINSNIDALTNLVQTNPGVVDSAIEAFQQTKTEIQVEASEASAPYNVLLEQVGDPTKLSKRDREELAVRAMLADQIQEIIAGQSLTSLLGDIALEFIPFKFLTDLAQASGTVNVFEMQDNIRKVISNFRFASPAEKRKLFPVIKEELLDKLPRFRAAQILKAMIDPTEQAAVDFEFGPLALIDAAAMAAGMLQIAYKAKTLFNTVKLVDAKAGNTPLAARLNTTILVDETGEVAEAAGISRISAVNSTLPFRTELYDQVATNEISGAAQNSLLDFKAKLQSTLTALDDRSAFIAEGILSDLDRPAAVKRIDSLFDKRVEKLRNQNKIIEVESVEKDIGPRGVTFKFTVADSDGGKVLGEFTSPFLVDDIGHYENIAQPGLLARIFGSQKARAFGQSIAVEVEAALRLDFVDAAAQTQLARLLNLALAPVTKLKPGRKESLKKVAKVLEYGDDTDDVFTLAELRAGINGFRLNDNEVAAYYNVRRLFDGLGLLRNEGKHRELTAKGVRTIFHEGKALDFGAPLTSADDAIEFLGKQPTGTQVYDLVNKKPILIRDLDVGEAYANAKMLVRLESDHIIAGGRWNLVLAEVGAIKQLPRIVLDLKKGYVPRLNPKSAWFVQSFSHSNLNGVRGTTRKVVRAFDNQTDANVFAKQLQAEIAAGETDFLKSTKLRVNRDKELEAFRVGDSGIGSSRGLIYGPRRSDPVPFGTVSDELGSPRLGAFESLSLYLENTKNFITRNEWRMGMRRRWENTARKMLLNKEISFEEPAAALSNAALKTWHEQIRLWSGLLDKSEAGWDDMVQAAYEVILPKIGRNKVSSFIHSLRHRDPIAMIKSVTFHSLLGALNPAQLVVQASGMAVALSLNLFRPDKMASFLFRQNALRAVENIEPGTKAFNAFAKAFGWKPDTLAKYRQVWKRTGLFESTLNNADYAAAQAGFGITGTAIRKALNTSLMFFREGELFNRRMAFMTAIDRLGGINKVVKSSALQRQALTISSDLTLALGRGNRAFWQRGIFSIPTQFLQIQTKTIEAFLGINKSLAGGVGGFGDRFKLGMTQWALYGAAAVPFGKAVNKWVFESAGLDQAAVNDPSNKDIVAFAGGGLTDWMFQAYLDTDIVLSDRLSLLNALDQSVFSFFENQSTMFEFIAGPSGGVAKRVWDQFYKMQPYFGRYFSVDRQEMTFDEATILDVTKFLLEDVGTLLVSPLSTASQVNRFIQMQDFDRLLNRRGDVIADREFNLRTEIAVLLGAKPLVQDQNIIFQQMNRGGQEYIRLKTDQIMYGFDRYLIELESARVDGRDVNSATVQRHISIYDVVIESIPDDNIKLLVMKQFTDRLRARGKGETQLDRQQNRFYRNFINDLANDIIDLNTKVIQTR